MASPARSCPNDLRRRSLVRSGHLPTTLLSESAWELRGAGGLTKSSAGPRSRGDTSRISSLWRMPSPAKAGHCQVRLKADTTYFLVGVLVRGVLDWKLLRAAFIDVDDEIRDEPGKDRLAADEDEQHAEHQQRARPDADALSPEVREIGQDHEADGEESRADAPEEMQRAPRVLREEEDRQ